MFRASLAVPAVVATFLLSGVASAQGLLWSLPAEDGTWIRFQGDYQQVLFDPTGSKVPTIEDARSSYQCDAAKLDFAEVICWGREVEIKSVGREKAMYRGEEVDCRWIEIKTTTGEKTDTGIVTGPTGTRIQKVLVPEAAVVAAPVDGEDIPVAYVPVVKGYQKIGNAEAKPLAGMSLQVYPMLTLVAQYRRVEADAAAGDPGLVLDAGVTTPVKGEIVVESKTDRSANTATLWRTDGLPFGLAKWEVTVIREKKDATVGRDRFVPVSRIHVEMKATRTGTDATSELVLQPGV